jgi:hypothetical protein
MEGRTSFDLVRNRFVTIVLAILCVVWCVLESHAQTQCKEMNDRSNALTDNMNAAFDPLIRKYGTDLTLQSCSEWLPAIAREKPLFSESDTLARLLDAQCNRRCVADPSVPATAGSGHSCHGGITQVAAFIEERCNTLFAGVAQKRAAGTCPAEPRSYLIVIPGNSGVYKLRNSCTHKTLLVQVRTTDVYPLCSQTTQSLSINPGQSETIYSYCRQTPQIDDVTFGR